MNSDAGTVRKIQDVLNEAYGMQGTSSLDRAAATKVLQQLRMVGWMSPDEIAFLVDAAGGRIEVTQQSAEEKTLKLEVFRPFQSDSIVFKSSRS